MIFTLLLKFTNEYSPYNIPEIKLKAYSLAGKYCCKHKEYHKAYIYFNDAVENAIAANDYDQLIICKIDVYDCLTMMGNCKEGIKYITQILNCERNLSYEHKYYIYHRLGHGYLRLEDFKSALEAFENASKYVDTTNMHYVADLYEQRAFCYRFMLRLPETIDTLKEGIKYLNTDLYEQLKFRQDLFENKLYFTKLCLINNLICAYRYLGDKESMNPYIDDLLSIMNPTTDKLGPFVITIYCELFDHYMYLENYSSADDCITRALHVGIEQQNFYYQNEVLKKMFLLYKQSDDKEKIKSLFPYINNILVNSPEKINTGSIAAIAIENQV
jgi:tetratricopeptide (TPR) repeat protein